MLFDRSRTSPASRRRTIAAGAILAATLAAPLLADPPATPAPVNDILYARNFRLDVGFASRWGVDQPLVTEGTILVLEVDPELVRPRQVAEPVLYVGDRVAQRIHRGWPSGRMIVLVPGEVDLENEAVFFGSAELPERIDRAMAAGELDRARSAGMGPLPGAAVARARSEGGATLRAYDSVELDEALADLYERFVTAGGSASP